MTLITQNECIMEFDCISLVFQDTSTKCLISLLSPDKVWTGYLTYLEIAASQKRSIKFSVYHKKSASAYTWCWGLNRRYGSLGRQYDGLLSFMKYPRVTNTAQKVFELQLLSWKCYKNMKILNLEDLLHSGLSSRYSSHIESRKKFRKDFLRFNGHTWLRFVFTGEPVPRHGS